MKKYRPSIFTPLLHTNPTYNELSLPEDYILAKKKKKKSANYIYHLLIICLLRLDMVQIFSRSFLRDELRALPEGITGNTKKD